MGWEEKPKLCNRCGVENKDNTKFDYCFACAKKMFPMWDDNLANRNANDPFRFMRIIGGAMGVTAFVLLLAIILK